MHKLQKDTFFMEKIHAPQKLKHTKNTNKATKELIKNQRKNALKLPLRIFPRDTLIRKSTPKPQMNIHLFLI